MEPIALFHLLIVYIISQAAVSSAVTVWRRRLGFGESSKFITTLLNKHHSRPHGPGMTLKEHAGVNAVGFVTPRFDIIRVESDFV